MRAKDAQPSRQCQRSAGNVSSPFPSISSALPQEEQRRACFIVATNILEETSLSDEELVGSYKQQGSVERGFRFLKDPLFLAPSVFVKKPERFVALGFIMVLCLLVYRFALISFANPTQSDGSNSA